MTKIMDFNEYDHTDIHTYGTYLGKGESIDGNHYQAYKCDIGYLLVLINDATLDVVQVELATPEEVKGTVYLV